MTHRTTWPPPRAVDRVAASGGGVFDDFPTQPIAVGRSRGALVLGDPPTHPVAPSRRPSSAHRQPPGAWQRHAAPPGGVSHRKPARPAGSTIFVVVAVVAVVAVAGALGYESWSSWSSWPVSVSPISAAPAPETGVPRAHPPPGGGGDHDRPGGLGTADGAVPDGVTVFDDEFPAVANLDPDLLQALRDAARAADDDGVEFSVTSGWRSPEYQEHLLDEAIAEYGSKKEAARWVATPETSLHVSGDAVDIGPTAATAWLSEHGAEFGLCQIYRNEPWHYELRPDAADSGCPRMYADPTHDPRMQK